MMQCRDAIARMYLPDCQGQEHMLRTLVVQSQEISMEANFRVKTLKRIAH